MPVFECGTVWSPLAEGPFFNGTLVPRIQLAILKTSKIMSWPRLARPRDLVGSLVWRGDDRATEIFFLCPSGGLRSASESPCSACLTPYTQTCPACLPVLLCLLYVVLLFRMLGALANSMCRSYSRYLKSQKNMLAIKFWRFSVLGMGVWG